MFKWGQGKGGETRFETVAAPVADTMVWLCEKCGSKLSRDGGDGLTRKLQKAMKEVLSQHKEKRHVRVMASTCMNICPEGKMAASIADIRSSKTRFIAFEVRGNIDQVAQNLYKHLRS